MDVVTSRPGHYGCLRDRPDARDHSYTVPAAVLNKLPSQVDLRPQCPPVYEQRPLESCTANAVAGAIQFERMRHALKPDFTPSRLFIFYNERSLAGITAADSGVPIRDAIKAVKQRGDCPESEWPYDVKKFAERPPESCYRAAVRYMDMSYARLPQDLQHIKGCLAAGQPFILGFMIHASFETPAAEKTCTVPMPQSGDKLVGRHAVMAVGYDDAKGVVILRNSWGPHWGVAGYFYMPYAYISDPGLACDLWAIKLLPGKA
jgi:C1A family cysteine protease